MIDLIFQNIRKKLLNFIEFYQNLIILYSILIILYYNIHIKYI